MLRPLWISAVVVFSACSSTSPSSEDRARTRLEQRVSQAEDAAFLACYTVAYDGQHHEPSGNVACAVGYNYGDTDRLDGNPFAPRAALNDAKTNAPDPG